MKIYIIIKAALQEFGEYSMSSIEAAFEDKTDAENYVKNLPVTWNEKFNNVNFVCERAVHEVELTKKG